jgi:hypothetical protein
MGKHAVISAGQDVYGNERHKMAPRVRVTERRNGTEQTRKFDRLAGPVVSFPGMEGITHEAPVFVPVARPFDGVNPIAGQEFRLVEPGVYRLRVREGYITLKSFSVKGDDKSFKVWVARFGQKNYPLISNNGQALGFAAAKDKLFALLVTAMDVPRVTRIMPADKVIKPAKPKAVNVEFDVCQVSLEPMRVCEHCH